MNVAISSIPHTGKAGLPKPDSKAKRAGIKVAVADVILANANRMTTRLITSVAIIAEGRMCSIPKPPNAVFVSQAAAPVSSKAWPSDTATEAITIMLPMLAALLKSLQFVTPMYGVRTSVTAKIATVLTSIW